MTMAARVSVLVLLVAAASAVQREIPSSLRHARKDAQMMLEREMTEQVTERSCPNNCYGRGPCIAGTCICPREFGGDDCSREMKSCPNYCSGNGLCETTENGPHCICTGGFTGIDCSQAVSDEDAVEEQPQRLQRAKQGDILETQANVQVEGAGTIAGLLVKGLKQNHVELLSQPTTTTTTTTTAPSCPDDCNHHGECINDVCVCDKDWYGASCWTQNECEAGCAEPMVCYNETVCGCPAGRSGQMCEVVLCDPVDCNGHGECVDGACECTSPWMGTKCNIESLCTGTPPCSNHGHCALKSINDEVKMACECDKDYHGVDCHTHLPCIRDCSGHGLCDRGSCVCDLGFTGQDCATVIQCPRNCSGHGECLLGTCQCHSGYTSYDCSRRLPACPNGCSGVGTCFNNTCQCPSNYAGSDCSIRVDPSRVYCPNNCSGRGRCAHGRCECVPGWGGNDCTVEDLPCPNGCSGLGLCRSDGTCVCMEGRTGLDCSKVLPPNHAQLCAHNCSGHGVCTLGSCVCVAGYGGVDCSRSLYRCPLGCSGVGRCEGGTCVCDGGYSGEHCDSPVLAEYKCPRNCTGQGRCMGDVCKCYPGYTGTDCSKTLHCANNCSGHGLCIDGECLCKPGYGGVDECDTTGHARTDCSQVVPACPNMCSGHGNCTDQGKCACDAAFSGHDCSQPVQCPANCSGHGLCRGGGVCECELGFGGPSCAKALRGCAVKCPPHSKCNDTVCVCVDGYTGANCSLAPEPDAGDCPSTHPSLECSGRGRCVQGLCVCARHWYGPDCSLACPNNCSNTDCASHGLCINHTCHCLNGWSNFDCSTEYSGPPEIAAPPAAALVSMQMLAQHDATPTAPPTTPASHKDTDLANADTSDDLSPRHMPIPPSPSPEPVSHVTLPVSHPPRQQPPRGPKSAGTGGCLNDCSGHGRCVKGKCECTTVADGYGGPDCSVMLKQCPHACSGNGWCNTTSGVCTCARGFSGVGCADGPEASMPCPSNCSGNGLCQDGHCACGRETSGHSCAVYCPGGCSGHGVCVHGACMCLPHFHGEDCAVMVGHPDAGLHKRAASAAATTASHATPDAGFHWHLDTASLQQQQVAKSGFDAALESAMLAQLHPTQQQQPKAEDVMEMLETDEGAVVAEDKHSNNGEGESNVYEEMLRDALEKDGIKVVH